MTRLFIALPIDEDIRTRLLPLHQFFTGCTQTIKPVHPDHFHITMKFMGECEGNTARSIESAFMDIPLSGTAMDYTVKGIGMFPNEKKPSVIWTGIHTDLPRIREIWKAVETFALEFGIPGEKRSFIPHLTIARVRKGMKLTEKIQRHLKEYSDTVFGSSRFTTLRLYRSKLTPKGPEYTVLKELNME